MCPSIKEIIGRTKSIKKSNNITNAQLSEMSDIPAGTLNRLLAGSTQDVGIIPMAKIAQTLNVSLDYLVFGNNSPLSKAHTPEEGQLLLMFRGLDAPEQEKLLDQARILTEYCKHKPK